MFATKGGPRRAQHQQQQDGDSTAVGSAPAAYYLVGPWSTVLVDPSVWGFGQGLGMLQYTVKAATQRLLQVFCRAMPGWVQGLGMRPRLWRDKVGALAPATAPRMSLGAFPERPKRLP